MVCVKKRKQKTISTYACDNCLADAINAGRLGVF